MKKALRNERHITIDKYWGCQVQVERENSGLMMKRIFLKEWNVFRRNPPIGVRSDAAIIRSLLKQIEAVDKPHVKLFSKWIAYFKKNGL